MKVREIVTRFGIDADNQELESFDRGVRNLKIGLAALVGGAAAASASLFRFAQGTARTGDEIAKTSAQVGVSGQELQEWRHAADLAGVSAGSMDSALDRLNRRIGRARQGSGPAVEALEQLGITLTDNAGRARSNTEILDVLADRLAGMEDPAAAAGSLQGLVGTASGRMAAFLAQGSDAIREQRGELEMLGALIDDDGLRASEEFQDAMLRAKTVVAGLKNEVALGLVPVITEIIDHTRDWFLENRKIIRQRVQDTINLIVGGLRALAQFGRGAVETVSRLADRFGGWDRTISTILSGLGALGLMRVWKIIRSLAPQMSRVVRQGPLWKRLFGIMRVGLVGLLRLFPGVAAWMTLTFALQDIQAWVRGQESLIGELLGDYDTFWSRMRQGFRALWFDVRTMTGTAVDWIREKTEGLTDWWDRWFGEGTIGRRVLEFIDPTPDQLRMAAQMVGGVGEGEIARFRGGGGGGGGRGGGVQVDFRESVQINVPDGTSVAQARHVESTARAAIRDQFTDLVRVTFGDFPEHE